MALPLRVAGVPRQEIGARVGELLDLVGLSSKADAYPAMLSSVLVNMFRSIPFIILLVAMLPVTRMIVGTTMGT
ncbi:hypothetical protein Tamer19_60200 [Cupriavidus sp. TA19]|nr:hypothetical protein CTP10_R59220 [Cupriavidus sp. P-10]GLC96611.1 hypothetical protein Tamer19_60200 [Cupriavidus sp. TA19]